MGASVILADKSNTLYSGSGAGDNHQVHGNTNIKYEQEYVMKAKEGSKPLHKIKTEKDVYVSMRDGVKLAVDIYRPDAEGKWKSHREAEWKDQKERSGDPL